MAPKFLSLGDLKPVPVLWAWPNRIPFSAVTVVEGDPGDGKTTVVLDVVARLTSGRPMFNCDGKPSPKGALLILGEDDLATVIVPKLRALGADLTRVRAYDRRMFGEQPLRLPDDIVQIEREAAEINARLIVIDPIMAFLGGNAYSDQSVRKTMGPLASFAERTGAAIVLVRHHTKASSRNAVYRGGGSIGLIAAARSGLLVAPHPSDAEQRILAQFKTNHGRHARSLSFKIVDRDGVAQIDWVGESRLRADELIASSASEDRSTLHEAVFVVFSLLAEGRLPAKDAKTQAQDAGISSTTLKRAKKVLGVRSVRQGFGPKSHFFWQLPEQDELVERLRANEMEVLLEKLLDDTGDDGPPDWQGDSDPEDDDGGSPVSCPTGGDQG